MTRIRFVSTFVIFTLITGCNKSASAPTPDLFATLQASTPSIVTSPEAPQPSATAAFIFDTGITATATSISSFAPTSVPSPSSVDQPAGHIVFTCQIFKTQAAEQICIMNVDGTGVRRLTTEDNIRHFYPSLTRNGRSVLYSQYVEQNNYDIFRMDIADGSVDRLTNSYGVDNAPEESPDGQSITFMHSAPARNTFNIMKMDTSGSHIGNIPHVNGWDPTWSPDGNSILFASDRDGTVQLYTIHTDGSKLTRITNLPSIRGRSDWSSDGRYIVTYSGESWHRELYIMNADGSNVQQLTPSGGNSQGPSFSPDGKWVAFTAYFDHYGEDNGCEIYIIRIDGTDLRRLTNNDYCDYQPRWGP